MGSNQGKQPHPSDSGKGVWSRDERRWNRKQHRKAMEAEATEDSLSSNEGEEGTGVDERALEAERLAEMGIVRKQKPRHKKASRKWCKRKQGRAHNYVFVKEYKIRFPKDVLCEYRCEACGKTKIIWKKPEGRRDPIG